MKSGIRVGELRPSQLLWSFGVGSIVDLPNLSVVVSGLEEWQAAHATPVAEGRLLAGVRRVLGPTVSQLRMPPIPPPSNAPWNPFSEEAKVGVPVIPFPRYLRCPFCQALAPFDSGLFDLKEDPFRPERTRFVHSNCNKAKAPTAVPARFLVACRRGHLDDFPWRYFAHRGSTACTGQLKFFEQGASLETSDLWVACSEGDAAPRSMAEAFGAKADQSLPRCRGSHPHLREFQTTCDQPLRAILLGSSNSWFALTLSALAVPTTAGELEQIIADNWAALQSITAVELVNPVLGALQAIGQLLKLKKYSPDEIFERIAGQRGLEEGEIEVSGDAPDFHGPEWDVFISPNPPSNDEFLLRTVDPPPRYAATIGMVRLAERLREVNALIGFSRVEPPSQTRVGEIPVSRAPLSRQPPTWVPATEVRGEGIFLQFDDDRLSAWEGAVSEREELLRDGHRVWRIARRLNEDGFPGMRYVLLHSLAHLLLREFSLDCGYGAASIRERIYAEDGQAGVLLYTAAPDSEGTLGGLVALGEPESLQPLIDSALTRATSCASDPLCAEHDPRRDRSLHGAACHACLFVPETSCELGNRYLDRALVIPTFAGASSAFFELTLR